MPLLKKKELSSSKLDKSDVQRLSELISSGSNTQAQSQQPTQSLAIHEIVPTTFIQWTNSSISSSHGPSKGSLARAATGPCNLLTRKPAFEVSQQAEKPVQQGVSLSTAPTFQNSPFSTTKKTCSQTSLPQSEKDK